MSEPSEHPHVLNYEAMAEPSTANLRQVLRGFIGESLRFLLRLGLLLLVKLLVALFVIIEIIGIIALWVFALVECKLHDTGVYFWIPIGASFLLCIQYALWQFWWLRIAQRGGQWRALAECFSSFVRYPVVRPPHPWE
jgi:hypothetical protein